VGRESDQTRVTFAAWKPLGPFNKSNSTVSPSFKVRYPFSWIAEKWTKTSSPVERWIKPYPFAPLNHFTVPFSLTDYSFRLCAFEFLKLAVELVQAPYNPPGSLERYQPDALWADPTRKTKRPLSSAPRDVAAQSSEAILIARVSTAVHRTSTWALLNIFVLSSTMSKKYIHELGFWQEKNFKWKRFSWGFRAIQSTLVATCNRFFVASAHANI
jgi:hypothetical protein